MSAIVALATVARRALSPPMILRRIERYEVGEEIACGGMGSVHLGRRIGEGGFTKVVAVKALHPHLARQPDFRAMFLDEARTVAGIRHPHVVSTLDVLEEAGQLILVMDYVDGPSLSSVLERLRAQGERMPIPIARAIAADLLEGLHAAHEARSPSGEPLEIVHRDVSPQNVLLGRDGLARVVDFGIATATDRIHSTQPGEVKGKLRYMPPEQARGERVDRRADVFSAGATLFEMLTGETPFGGANAAETLFLLLNAPPSTPSALVPDIPFDLDDAVACALSKRVEDRFSTAKAMAEAVSAGGAKASADEVSRWLVSEVPAFFDEQDARLTRLDAAQGGEAIPEGPASSPRAGVEASASPRRGTRSTWGIATAALVSVGIIVSAVVVSTRPSASAAPAASSASSAGLTSPTELDVGGAHDVASTGPSASAPKRFAAPTERPDVGTPTAPKSLPRSATTHEARAEPDPSAKQLPCCVEVGGHWQRYSLSPTCVDNCPAVAPR